MPRTFHLTGEWLVETRRTHGLRCGQVSKLYHSPEGATVGTGQKEPRDSRQVHEDVQHHQGHVLGGVGGQPPGQQHPKGRGFCLSLHCTSPAPCTDQAHSGHLACVCLLIDFVIPCKEPWDLSEARSCVIPTLLMEPVRPKRYTPSLRLHSQTVQDLTPEEDLMGWSCSLCQL